MGRTVGLVIGAFLLVVGGVYGWIEYGSSDRIPTAQAAVSTTPALEETLPGDKMNNELDESYSELERQMREDARIEAARGEPAAAVPRISTLENQPKQPVIHPMSQPVQSHYEPEPEIDPEQAKEELRRYVDYLNGLVRKPANHTTIAGRPYPPDPIETDDDKTDADGATATVARLPLPVPIIPGDTHYGRLIAQHNTDEPREATGEIIDGPFAGARLSGEFQRRGDNMNMVMESMHFQGEVYSIKAYAVDDTTEMRLGIADHINNRTLSRWAALLSSSALEGWGNAFVGSGTTLAATDNATFLSKSDPTTREITGNIIGEIGTRTSQIANKYFNRPPTMTAYADKPVVFLFVSATK